MRRKRKAGRVLSAVELVEAVEAAGLAAPGSDVEARRDLLADLGYDPIQYLRARYALHRPDLVRAGYRWSDANTPTPRTTPRRTL